MYFSSLLLVALTFASSQAVQVGFIGKCVPVITSAEASGCDELFINATLRYKKVPAAESHKNVEHMFQYSRRMSHGAFRTTTFAKESTAQKFTEFSDQIRVMHGESGQFIGKPVHADAADIEFRGQILWCDKEVMYYYICSPDGGDLFTDYRSVLSTTGYPLTAEQEAKISDIDTMNIFKGDMRSI